ncbi:MAG: MBL fold metallo-hydrolase [Nitrospinae bacterium]|nr:MBL fold metallo-hydrolase [Nitrospinota bacterium]
MNVKSTGSQLIQTHRLEAPKGSFMEHVEVVLIGDGPFILFDTGYPECIPEMLSWVEARSGGKLEKLVLTHHHFDHSGGARAACDRFGVQAYAHPLEMGFLEEEQPGLPVLPIREGEFVELGDMRLEAILTPGHSPGHLSFWWEEEEILLGGDNILLPSTTALVAPKGNLGDYLESLEKVKSLAPRLIYPGHGPVLEDPIARIDELIEHRKMRGVQYLEALGAGHDTPAKIADLVYHELPERQKDLGARVISLYLERFVESGEVACADGRYSLTGPL